jgi:hypothetical protein
VNEERSHQNDPIETQATGWQVWFKRGPWIVLIVGMAGVGAQMGATLDLIANVKGQGVGWSITQAANTIGLAFMNAAIVFFLFLALRVLVTGIPKLWQPQAPALAPEPEPEPEAVPQEAPTEAVAEPSEPPTATTEEDNQGATG